MVNRVITFALFVSLAIASSFTNDDQLPEYLVPIFPEEFVKYINALTTAEKTALKSVIKKNESVEDFPQFLQAIRYKSTTLAAKIFLMDQSLNEQMKNLSDDGKELAKLFIKNAYVMHFQLIDGRIPTYLEIKNVMLQFIDKYNALSPKSKNDFKEQFPVFSETVANPFVQGVFHIPRSTDS